MTEDREVHRSADTGRFVTKEEAKANPKGTIRERVSSIDPMEMYQMLIGTAAHLAGAISLLERGREQFKQAAPSDTMFDKMLDDYRQSLDDVRRMLKVTDRRWEKPDG